MNEHFLKYSYYFIIIAIPNISTDFRKLLPKITPISFKARLCINRSKIDVY